MSTATAAPPADAAPPRTRKKLLLIVGAAVLALALVSTAGIVFLKQRAAAAAAAAEDEEDGAAQTEATPKRDPKAVPTFVPLDPFTVNLSDREAERYAQIGLSLELADAKEADRIKLFMPVIRNNILMVLAHKSSAELLERDGKARLAEEIRRETARALGVELPAATPAAGDDKPARAATAHAEPLPIAAVHFSNFIIQ